MTEVFDRRTEDKQSEAKLQAELDALVAAENDPSKRATLMVLNAINRSLTHNTAMTHSVNEGLGGLKVEFNKHVDNFAKHSITEEALLNKGRGAWMALAWFLCIVQGMVGYVIVETRTLLHTLEARSFASQLAEQTLVMRMERIEASRAIRGQQP